jgi:hypothetical protein
MHRNSERDLLEKIKPDKGVSENESFKKEYSEEEREGRTQDEVIFGGVFDEGSFHKQ